MERDRYKLFAGNGFHVFFVTKNGETHACGRNNYGQLGLGDIRDRSSPEVLLFFTRGTNKEIKLVSIGDSHTLFLTVGNVGYSCGDNNSGQLSIKNMDEIGKIVYPENIVLEKEESVVDVVCGYMDFSFVRTNKGQVYSFGDNRVGQLGLGVFMSVRRGKRIENLEGVKKICAGHDYAVFLTLSGCLFSCGYNDSGRLGVGSYDNVSTPREITFFKENKLRVNDVKVSGGTSYFILDTGEVYVCGDNEEGQYCEGDDDENSEIPILSIELSNSVSHLSENGFYFVIYKKIGFVIDDDESERDYSPFGISTRNVKTPTEIIQMRGKNVVQVVCSQANSYLITSKGDIYATGIGEYGGIMNGKFANQIGFTLALKGVDLMKRSTNSLNKHKRERLFFLMQKSCVKNSGQFAQFSVDF